MLIMPKFTKIYNLIRTKQFCFLWTITFCYGENLLLEEDVRCLRKYLLLTTGFGTNFRHIHVWYAQFLSCNLHVICIALWILLGKRNRTHIYQKIYTMFS